MIYNAKKHKADYPMKKLVYSITKIKLNFEVAEKLDCDLAKSKLSKSIQEYWQALSLF